MARALALGWLWLPCSCWGASSSLQPFSLEQRQLVQGIDSLVHFLAVLEK